MCVPPGTASLLRAAHGLCPPCWLQEDHYVTSDGLERTWAVNMASPFLLTAELLPLIT